MGLTVRPEVGMRPREGHTAFHVEMTLDEAAEVRKLADARGVKIAQLFREAVAYYRDHAPPPPPRLAPKPDAAPPRRRGRPRKPAGGA